MSSLRSGQVMINIFPKPPISHLSTGRLRDIKPVEGNKFNLRAQSDHGLQVWNLSHEGSVAKILIKDGDGGYVIRSERVEIAQMKHSFTSFETPCGNSIILVSLFRKGSQEPYFETEAQIHATRC